MLPCSGLLKGGGPKFGTVSIHLAFYPRYFTYPERGL